MSKTLLVIGGSLNVLFGLLHIWMGWGFHPFSIAIFATCLLVAGVYLAAILWKGGSLAWS